MDCFAFRCSLLWIIWKIVMIFLTLEENQVLENGQPIQVFSEFLKRLSVNTEITLILKTHDVTYHVCPLRKAVPFLKAAEFSADCWVGEWIFSKGQTRIGGVLPTPFMREIIREISAYSFALKGVYLWADLIRQSYGSLSLGWTLIEHEGNLLICQDEVLRFSRKCDLPMEQELPLIMRYIKRFGYEVEMPITLMRPFAQEDNLPWFVQKIIRLPQDIIPGELSLQIPELIEQNRLYDWPRKIQKIAYSFLILNSIVIALLCFQIKILYEKKYRLSHEKGHLQASESLDERKLEAFAAYRQLSKDRGNPLFLVRQLIPVLKDQAVATYFHWTMESLTLQLELNPTVSAEQFFLTLRSQFSDYQVTWKAEENESLKGILTLEKRLYEN